MTTSASWLPLLTGDLAAKALATVAEIVRALDDKDRETTDPRFASLAGGTAGEALFHAYLALHSGEEQPAERAAALLESAVDTLATTVMPPGLYGGFAGVAWTVEHLQSRLFAAEPNPESPEDPTDEEDPNREIDEALLAYLGAGQGEAEYDLIGGFTGIGVYGRERLAHPTGVALLESVVERLAAQAETGPAGTAWYTPPSRLPVWQREVHPAGLYNLGAAHGMPAVAALLGVASAAGVARAQPLLDDVVRWLLAHRLPAGSGSCFSTFFIPDGETPPSRLAWCYGDPGVAANLLVAARAVGERDWEREALAVARLAAARPVETAGIRDAGICHGAAGLAHLFNRFWQASGEEAFAAAARFWIEQALELRVPGEGVAGFRAWRALTGPGEEHWIAEPGFLEGAAGIGLVLLAAVSTVEPEWDRILLVS
jgi:hypothetical protein